MKIIIPEENEKTIPLSEVPICDGRMIAMNKQNHMFGLFRINPQGCMVNLFSGEVLVGTNIESQLKDYDIYYFETYSKFYTFIVSGFQNTSIGKKVVGEKEDRSDCVEYSDYMSQKYWIIGIYNGNPFYVDTDDNIRTLYDGELFTSQKLSIDFIKACEVIEAFGDEKHIINFLVERLRS